MVFFLNPPVEGTVNSKEQKTLEVFNLISKNSISGYRLFFYNSVVLLFAVHQRESGSSVPPRESTHQQGNPGHPLKVYLLPFLKKADIITTSVEHIQIRLMEINAKCLKKLTSKGTLRQVFFLSEAPSRPLTP